METNITSPPPTYSRTFYVWWFALFTLISMGLNGTHAFIAAPRAWAMTDESIRRWLEVGSGMPTWFAVTAVLVSQIPPVALACATNALVKPDPNTTSGRGSAARTTTWTIASGAFVLSAIAMTDLTHMLLGVPLYVAAIMPVIVDVSIVAAVLRLEIRRAQHRAEAHLPDVEHPEQQESVTHDAALVHDDAPMEQAVKQTATPHDALHDAPQEQPVKLHGAVHEAVEEHPVTRDLVHPESIREAVGESKRSTADPFVLTADADQLAARIATETTISLPVRSIAAVLKRAASGESQRKIAGALKGVSPTTVGRVITAAKDLQETPQRELVAV